MAEDHEKFLGDSGDSEKLGEFSKFIDTGKGIMDFYVSKFEEAVIPPFLEAHSDKYTEKGMEALRSESLKALEDAKPSISLMNTVFASMLWASITGKRQAVKDFQAGLAFVLEATLLRNL